MRDARRAVLVAGLIGHLALAVAGALAAPLLPLTALLLVLACEVGDRADAPRLALLRHLATGLAGVAAVATLPALLSGGDLRAPLGLLLVAISVAQSSTWQSRRELGTGLLIAVALHVLAASYASDVLVGLPLVLGWAACVVALVLLQAYGRTVDADATAGPQRPRLLPATALSLSLGLVAFLLVPVAPTDQVRRGQQLRPDAAGSRSQVYTGDRVDLRGRGDLSDRPLAEVTGDGALWRSAAYDRWDGSSWTAPYDAQQAREPAVLRPYEDDAQAVAPGSRSDAVRLLSRRSVVWSPGLPVAVQADVEQLSPAAGGALRVPPSVDRYVVESLPLEQDPARLRRAVAGTDAVDPRFLQLPAQLPQRVRALAREITAGATTDYDKVVAVEQWLGQNATYRLDSPVPPPGQDAVDAFLFDDLIGFCEQFASAQAVLLRAVGVPTRLVVGLAYGEAVGSGRRLFRENMLHAWVEVLYPGLGWSSSDPTAGAAQAAVTTSLRSRLAADVAAGLRGLDELPGGRPALTAAVLVLVGAALLRGRRRSPAEAAPIPAVAGPRVTGGPERHTGPALSAFLRWDGRRGPQARAATESLGELSLRVPPALAHALTTVEQECYAASPPGEGRTAAAVQAFTSVHELTAADAAFVPEVRPDDRRADGAGDARSPRPW